jgi:hypothetical protein
MASSAKAAKSAFLAIATDALPAGITVKFDSNADVYIAPKSVLVTGISWTQDAYAELGPTYRHEEHYNLECSMWSAYGDNDQDARMDEVMDEMYTPLQIAIAGNPTLNDTVRLAWCRLLDYNPTHDGAKGWAIGSLTFQVQCQARVESLS